MEYSERIVQRERLYLLQLLTQDSDKSMTEYELKQSMQALGQQMSGDSLKQQLRWLESQWLITVSSSALAMTGMVIRLTERGLDVASGTPFDGVETPRKEVL
ncbi:MAG: hypothetical protein CMI09_03350 [Oceanospirillaceae bacterium]|nr:hypothetical protein [Oceanospirillaceae bacterium]|tara:strand:+ start:1004 stop:1309 length:306 start_codon:yes stop_codon:yes gene_type:complete